MLKTQLPVGIRDDFGLAAQVKQKVETVIVAHFRQRGFQKISTPILEDAQVFNAYQMANQQMYRLLTEEGKTLVLRPDLTLPIARFLSSTNMQLPQKFYYLGERFRIHRRLSGSNNEATQAGMELVGYDHLKAEQECLQVILNLGQQLQVPLQLELGLATFVPQVLQAITNDEQQQTAISTALFNKQITAYQKLIKPYENSDFADFLTQWPRLFGQPDWVWQQLESSQLPSQIQQSLQPLKILVQWLTKIAPEVAVTIDLSAQAPQAYYTGVTFQASYAGGANAVFSGGRYDRLLANFQEQAEPAVGMGVDVAALTQFKLQTAQAQPQKLIYFRPDQWSMAEALLKKVPDSTLSLAADLPTAKAEAEAKGWQLIDLSEEGAQ